MIKMQLSLFDLVSEIDEIVNITDVSHFVTQSIKDTFKQRFSPSELLTKEEVTGLKRVTKKVDIFFSESGIEHNTLNWLVNEPLLAKVLIDRNMQHFLRPTLLDYPSLKEVDGVRFSQYRFQVYIPDEESIYNPPIPTMNSCLFPEIINCFTVTFQQQYFMFDLKIKSGQSDS